MEQQPLFAVPEDRKQAVPAELPANVWLCAQEPAQLQRRGRYTAESNLHPAKMLPELARQIVLHYSDPGDLVLDPMAGIGTTLVEAAHLGRNAVGVEYEEKFVALAAANLELARAQGAPGQMEIRHGDARRLSDVLADLVAFSPPYGNRIENRPDTLADRVERMKEAGLTPHPDWVRKARCRAPGDLAVNERGYSEDPENLGNLPYREVDEVDVVATSPPYQGLEPRGEDHPAEWGDGSDGVTRVKADYARQDSPGNLSRAPSYLGEMAVVYQECFRVLRPGGFMVVVTKNFRRDGTLVDLAGDTITLCRRAGFGFYQHVIALLCGVGPDGVVRRASFWQQLRTRQARARGERMLLIQHEDVLVFEKPRRGNRP